MYHQKMIQSFLATDQEWAMVVPTATRRPHILRQFGGGRRSRRQASKLFGFRHQTPNLFGSRRQAQSYLVQVPRLRLVQIRRQTYVS